MLENVGGWARLEVRSPLAGTLLERNASVGDVVTPDTALFVVADLSQLQVEAEASQDELPALQALQARHEIVASAILGTLAPWLVARKSSKLCTRSKIPSSGWTSSTSACSTTSTSRARR